MGSSITKVTTWHIVNARSAVSHFVAKCVMCRRLRGHAHGQKMADLPPERVTPAPPFTYTGMDVFGPFYIKEGRKGMQRWGLIFTCLSSRAITALGNFELHDNRLVPERTQSASQPLKKSPRVRSDQETNFVGAKNEPYAALKKTGHCTPERILVFSRLRLDWLQS